MMLFVGGILSAQNTTVVKAGAEKIEYNPKLFGFFIEHFDNQIYGGIFDPGNPLSDEDGFRTDVIEAIKDLKVPIVRWPGGCFASTYHWYKGVGPERTPVFDKTWGVEDPNTFGTDEFVKWCKKIGCEPYIVANAGIGTREEMSDWVEYCNLSIGEYGRKRIANGFPEPYNVKYWCIGNETLAPWEMGVPTEEKVVDLVHGERSIGVLDVILTSDKEGKRFVYAVANKDPDNDQPLTLDFQGLGIKAPKKVQATVLSGKSPDDYNDIGVERVKPESRTLQIKNGTVTIPAHSVTFISID